MEHSQRLGPCNNFPLRWNRCYQPRTATQLVEQLVTLVVLNAATKNAVKSTYFRRFSTKAMLSQNENRLRRGDGIHETHSREAQRIPTLSTTRSAIALRNDEIHAQRQDVRCNQFVSIGLEESHRQIRIAQVLLCELNQ